MNSVDSAPRNEAERAAEIARINGEIAERRAENFRWIVLIASGVFIGLSLHSLAIYVLVREWVERSI